MIRPPENEQELRRFYQELCLWVNLRLFGGTSNHTVFDSTGHQTMVGTARPWRDELGELLTKKKKGARITEDAEEGTVVFATNCVVADDHVILNVQLNHDKDLSAGIYPHLHFFQTENAVPNFLLQYRWQVNGAAKTTSWTNLKCTNLAFTYTAGTIQQIAYSAAITPPSGSDLSDIVQFKICRDTANVTTLFPTPGADPFTTAVHVLMFDVHFQINSIGSTDELTK